MSAVGGKRYLIGEVSRMLGVKRHVIRYWEQEFPFIAPRKSRSGRREYTASEVRLLMRLKHHLHCNRYTLEGARKRMWREIEGVSPETQALLGQIRADLIDVLARVHRLRALSDRES